MYDRHRFEPRRVHPPGLMQPEGLLHLLPEGLVQPDELMPAILDATKMHPPGLMQPEGLPCRAGVP